MAETRTEARRSSNRIIDTDTLVPVTFIAVVGSVCFWLASLSSSLSSAEQELSKLRQQVAENDRYITEKIAQVSAQTAATDAKIEGIIMILTESRIPKRNLKIP